MRSFSIALAKGCFAPASVVHVRIDHAGSSACLGDHAVRYLTCTGTCVRMIRTSPALCMISCIENAAAIANSWMANRFPSSRCGCGFPWADRSFLPIKPRLIRNDFPSNPLSNPFPSTSSRSGVEAADKPPHVLRCASRAR